jgi:uncharacterized protein
VAVPWSIGADGVTLLVRLTPKGGRDAIDGVEQLADGTCVLKARVRAAPTEGAANDALIRLLAKAGDVPPRNVAIASGATSRVKRVTLAGDAARIVAALEKSSAAR